MKKITLFWFRRDLRLEDNVGLNTALHEGNNVLPLFIFDTDILQRLQKNDARVNFLHNRIEELNRQLQPKGKKIHVFQGKPLDEDTIFHMKRELGDVMWYWINACRALNLDPNEVIAENVNKLEARYPGGSFDPYYSENRVEGDL